MRLHRFYVSQPLGEEVVIEDVSTIKQWLKVFRYTKGDFVILFNGDGKDYTYSLEKTSPSACSLTRTASSSSCMPTRKSYLFLSVIKKDLFELVVEKATECGITDIVPIYSERTEKKNLNLSRLESIIKEASEQSGRGTLLTLHEPLSLLEALEKVKEEATLIDDVYVATLFGKTVHEILSEKISSSKGSSVAFFVGPEGGWSDAEEELFKNGQYTQLFLGKTTLRAETAGITCAILASLL